MTVEIDDLSSLLGEIRARLTAIERNQENEIDQTRKHREALLVTITAQAQATSTLDAKVSMLEARFIKVELLTDAFRTFRDEESGKAKLVLFFRGLILFLVTTVGGIITWLVGRH